MRAPIALLIFNRPDLTERVFAEIARARPERLLVIADGPRPGVDGEAARCAAARAVIERVDWPCEVLKNYSDANMGCALRPSTGLQWVFEQVGEAIILEDDCLPHPAFFRYCNELLERYRDDERVMHISGDQFVDQPAARFSYSFSRYCLSWGWATWRRAFKHYDFEMALWPELKGTQWLTDVLGDPRAVAHWTRIFDLTHASVANVNTWDFQWVFACWVQSGLSVLPSVNLISNIGFREDATHTTRVNDGRANRLPSELVFPMRHPDYMLRSQEEDKRIFDQVVAPAGGHSLASQLRGRVVGALPNRVRLSMSSLRSLFVSSASES